MYRYHCSRCETTVRLHCVLPDGHSPLCRDCEEADLLRHRAEIELENAAADLLVDMPGGVNPERVAKLAAVLAEHPNASLETCGDEKTGRRFGQAACRRGRTVKIGSSGFKYQIWAVWPSAVQA